MAMTTIACPVQDPSQVAEARRGVLSLASRFGFDEERSGRCALIVSELATNLVKHARHGEILLGTLRNPAAEPDALEVVAIDKGPGIPDLARAARDGHSTAGSLGHGLGAVRRLADHFELHSDTAGTAALARVNRHGSSEHRESRFDVGAVQVAKQGEGICGDDWAFRARQDRLSILVADGLGHGLHAHEAAAAAVGAYAASHEHSPARVIQDVHHALRHTRGAAVAMLAIDVPRAVAQYAGLGNISGVVLVQNGDRRFMVSHNGTAGHTAGRIQEFSYPVPHDALVVMFSDGLSSNWDLAAYPGLQSRSATLVAAVLYRDSSRRRDDVTVVVAKPRPAVAEKL